MDQLTVRVIKKYSKKIDNSIVFRMDLLLMTR